MNQDYSIVLTGGYVPKVSRWQLTGIIAGVLGVLLLLLYWAGGWPVAAAPTLLLSISLLFAGVLIYTRATYKDLPAGIKNNQVFMSTLTSRGVVGWAVAILLTAFYSILYFQASWMGLGTDGNDNTGIVALFDPLSQLFKGQAASQWFVYGTLYTVAILTMGIKFIVKYWHNKYQIIRTVSVMFFQLAFAFLIPEILEGLNNEKAYFGKDLKNIWPLNYYFFEDWHLRNMLDGGNLGLFFLIWGILLFTVISPVLTYFYGKRWYCSWVCGCGGLAETAGDPFRQLSDKSLRAWKIERWMIHLVLVFAVVMTALVLYRFFKGNSHFLFIDTYAVGQWYGWLIGAAFAGVAGVGFYPIMGSRVWCRFGCPMAAILGIQQKFFSRFRITTNGGQCISCGNCSTYCEMGIDVRWYAQRGQNIVRASCVGCGICSAVCPRGVLRLENGPEIANRTDELGALHVK